jgi:hypothetical protein
MSATAKQAIIDFPDEWRHVESSGVGPFTTRIVHRRSDNQLHSWSSRRHRKGFGAEIRADGEAAPHAEKRPSLFLWAPRSLNWWIALLFMIGSSLFIVGSLLYLTGNPSYLLIDVVFFTGSLFFTSAGYSSYYQAINAAMTVGDRKEPQKRKAFAWQPARIDFWITFLLFLGTIMFNFSTFDAFLDLGLLGVDLLIWVPDTVGSILFLLSGTLGVFELCHRFWCWRSRSIAWWIVTTNFVGCIAFMISAIFAFVRPDPILDNLATYATLLTLIGAVCFLLSSYLMWPEMTVEAVPEE